MFSSKYAIILLFVIGIVLIAGCTSEIPSGAPSVTPTIHTPTQTTGTPSIADSELPATRGSTDSAEKTRETDFVLLVSDAQADIADFEHLNITLSAARIFRADKNNGDAGFEERSLDDATVDLTQIIGEKAIRVLEAELEPGNYTKIELYVESVEAVLSEGGDAEVEVPSDKLQITKPFNITEDETTTFVFDIHVVRKGHEDSYNLLPVIDQSGVVGEDLSEDEVEEIDEENEDELDEEDEEEDEIEIEVEIGEEGSIVSININGEKDNFSLETTDEEDIITEIADRTGLEIDEIEEIIEFTYPDSTEE